MASLYVGNLDYAVDETDIYELFSEFEIRAVHMKFTYCFVTLSSRNEARVAMSSLDGISLFDRRIRIQWARSNYDPGGIFNPVEQPNRYQDLNNSASSLASSASSQGIVSISQPPSVTLQDSAASLQQPVNENTLLECEICFVSFDYNTHRPRSLPCGHSLCSLCITKNLKADQEAGNDAMLCPFCRTSCGPYKRRVGQFPETFFILKMLEVESEKAKGNEEEKDKKKEAEEKKKREEKKKEQEEEYLKFQKQIGLDSTMSGIISCKDHLESLEDLHKEQSSVKKQLKTQRKRLFEEIRQVESELMEISDQMFNIEVWIASGRNLLTKFDSIQEKFSGECNRETIEISYEAAERCCLATQRWSDGSAQDLDKMNEFVKRRKRENEEVAELSEALGELNRLSETSLEEASNVLSASGSRQRIQNAQRKISKKRPSENIHLNSKRSDSVSDDGSDVDTMSSDEPEPTIRVVSSGDNGASNASSERPKLFIKKPSTRDKSTFKSTAETSTSFNLTNTSSSYDFGSTSNPFQTNVFSTSTAAVLTSTTTTSTTITNSLPSLSSSVTSSNTNLFSNTSSASGRPLFSSSNTNTVSTSFSMGNLSQPSASGNSSTSTSNAAVARSTSSEDTSIRNTLPSASVRPKVNSKVVLSEARLFQSPPNTAADLSKSELSLLSTNEPRKTSFSEHADLHKKANVAFNDLLPKFRFDGSSFNMSNVNTTNLTTNTATTTAANNISTSTVCKSTTFANLFTSSSPLSTSLVDNPLDNALHTTKLGFSFSKAATTLDKSSDKNSFNFSSMSSMSTLNLNTTLETTSSPLDTTAQISKSVLNIPSSFSFQNAVPTQNNKNSFNSSSKFSMSTENLKSALENCAPILDINAPKSNSGLNPPSSFSFQSAVSTQNKVCNENSFTFGSGSTSTAATVSVRPKMSNSLSQINAVDNTDSIFSQDNNLSGKSDSDKGSMKRLPSFNFTMSPGKFSGIKFVPSTSAETAHNIKTKNSTGLSFTNSNVTPKVSSFELGSLEKPISFNLKPKNFNFFSFKFDKKYNLGDSEDDSS